MQLNKGAAEKINNSSPVAQLTKLGDQVRQRRHTAEAVFDFAINGGSIGAKNLGEFIPRGAVIRRAWYDVLSTFTSGTDAATIALQVESAGDLVTAIAISDVSNPWDAGIHDAIPVDTAATAIKTSAVNELQAVVAVEALTGGRLRLFVEYMLSE
jgi:hypothetical protein